MRGCPAPAPDVPDRTGQRPRLGHLYPLPLLRQKCPYCDFNSHVKRPEHRAYREAVLREFERRGPAFQSLGYPLRSIFFGGGTPNLWDPDEVGIIIEHIREACTGTVVGGADGCLPESDRATDSRTKDLEITLECNPESATEWNFAAYRKAGVNRFSIGAQSFDPNELQQLGRLHSATASADAVRWAQASGARVSMDLIYGLPGQSEKTLNETLARALALEPEHFSAYTLTIEPGTVFGRQTRLGRFHPMPDDDQAALMETVRATFENAGYQRYEISNFAKPGAVSRHNLLYWVGAPYLGLGAGAHSHLPTPDFRQATRRENVRDPESYLRAEPTSPAALSFEEHLSTDEVVQDRLMTGFRTRWGINLVALGKDLERPLVETLASAVREAQHAGWLHTDPVHLRPTNQGFLMNNALVRLLAYPPI